MSSFSTWCLLCAGEKDVYINIKDIPELHQMIGKFSIINFTLIGFPSKICEKCHQFLKYYNIKSMRYEKAEKLFLELLKSRNTNTDASSVKKRHGLDGKKTEVNDDSLHKPDDYELYEIIDLPEQENSEEFQTPQPRRAKLDLSQRSLENHTSTPKSSVRIERVQKSLIISSDPNVNPLDFIKPRPKLGVLPSELYSCDQCPHHCSTKQALIKHMVQIHLSNRRIAYCCKICFRTFARKNVFAAHQRIHLADDQKSYNICQYCDMKLSSSTAVINHIKNVHNDQKDFKCGLCSKEFSTKGTLKQHESIHSNELNHICPICSKAFKVGSTLRNHLDTHGMVKYNCAICSQELNSKRTLRHHMLKHSNVTSHTCPNCGTKFKRTKGYKEHLMTHIEELRPYACDWCKKTFTNASNCRKHKREVHPDQLRNSELETTPKKIVKLPTIAELEAMVQEG